MNAKLQSMLSNFPATLEAAESNEQIREAVIGLENAVLRANVEENSDAPFVARDYVVGEPNTRGLSWKLNLLRQVAAANFCQLMRIGVHGGNTRVLGQEENLDITFQVYDALVAKYETLAQKEFQSFSDAQGKEENAEKAHRVGWTGQFLINAPTEVFEAVNNARTEGANAKVTALIEKKNEGLNQLRSSFTPARTPAAPKSKKSAKNAEASEAPETEEQVQPDETGSASEA